jgi:hypothetical protein
LPARAKNQQEGKRSRSVFVKERNRKEANGMAMNESMRADFKVVNVSSLAFLLMSEFVIGGAEIH